MKGGKGGEIGEGGEYYKTLLGNQVNLTVTQSNSSDPPPPRFFYNDKWPVLKHLNIKWKLSKMRWTVVFTLNLLPTLMNPSFLLPDRVIGEPNDNEPISLFFGATPGNKLLRKESLLSCINSSRSLWRASLSFSIKSDWNEITDQGFH